MEQPKEIFVRTERCMGCRSCINACAVEHSTSKTLFGAISENPKPKSRVYVEWLSPDHKVPIVCRHCEDAPCMHACIAGAIRKTATQTVVSDTDKCIGCWTCVMVCPYGVIGRHLDLGTAYRCDRCPDRAEPACVSACPTGALVYRSAGQFAGAKRAFAAQALSSGSGG